MAKSLLFTSSAGIEAATGRDDLEELRGRARRTPWSGFGLAVGSLTLARAVARGPGLADHGHAEVPLGAAPVFDGFSILSPSWLWAEMPLTLLLTVLFAWAVARRRLLRVRRLPA